MGAALEHVTPTFGVARDGRVEKHFHAERVGGDESIRRRDAVRARDVDHELERGGTARLHVECGAQARAARQTVETRGYEGFGWGAFCERSARG